ncbi:MAG: protein-L-isoaspartate(D-aspartate) O-methyltransferase [Planctomycetota bacterium]
MNWERERRDMVQRQLRARGIRDERVLEAFRAVPRHRFLRPVDQVQSYEDHPVAIDCGQTISQPYIVALMTELLDLSGDERALEVGTGSGYQTAILAELCAEVYSLERYPELSREARLVLDQLGYDHVHLRVADGTLGWSEAAPFDAVLVTAGGPKIPPSLKDQLADGGRLVMPVGGRRGQDLVKLTRHGERFEHESHGGCMFVRLIGDEAWPEA